MTMANIEGEFFCCADCACFIANNDTSGMDLYDPQYRTMWESGVETTRPSLPDGYPVVTCGEECDDSQQEFMCDFCSRNVYSTKHELSFLT
ncbi:hypothetical protein CL96_gp116 [Mycobacterium phage Firecracker]|uniref:Uncharacterized protein n=1 Tax=Mycobacterium phage Firecracker TaxID=2922998 RepID=G8I498_9CAUD|nr:hypothetical protein CL96_gp116 [Mycobacterium phage Firecracker]AER47542.1 hypothetical protein FIRECRACKER_116 [Mycobacterium phage Firecracker]